MTKSGPRWGLLYYPHLGTTVLFAGPPQKCTSPGTLPLLSERAPPTVEVRPSGPLVKIFAKKFLKHLIMDSYESSSEDSDSHERSSSPRSRGRSLAPQTHRYKVNLKGITSCWTPTFVDTAGPRIGAVPGECRCHPSAKLISQTEKLVRSFPRADPTPEGETLSRRYTQTVLVDAQQLYGRRNNPDSKVRGKALPISNLWKGNRPDNR